MNKRHRAELRAGLFLNLGLLITMLVLFLFRSNLRISSHAVHYHFTLPDAQGLVVGTKVLVAGLEAGKVDHLELDENARKVRVDIDISRKFRNAIRRDSEVDLATQGVLGDKVVTILPGSPQQPLIPMGGDLPARVSSSLTQVLGRSQTLMVDLDHLVRNLSGLVEAFGGEDRGRRIARDAARALENLAQLSEKLNQGMDGQELASSLKQLHAILSKMNEGTGTLGALLNDPELYDDAKALVGQANRTRIVRNLVRKSIEDSEELEAEKGKG